MMLSGLANPSPGSGKKPTVCFVAPRILPALVPEDGAQDIGGAEVQQRLLGYAFAHHGWAVRFVCQGSGKREPFQLAENITIDFSFDDTSGMPGLRFLHPRLTGMWQALKRADADVYYLRGATYLTSVVAHFCKRYGRAFVFAGASDANFDPGLLAMKSVRDKFLYEYGLRRADLITVQSERQARLLSENHALPGVVVRNLWDQRARATPTGKRTLILWVAMFRKLKQAEHFVRLASFFPEEHFLLVGGPNRNEPDYYNHIVQMTSSLNNVEMTGFLAPEETDMYFERAKALVNTSTYEGFPNTFLQAWSRGVPCLSYVDPDDLISSQGLGETATSEAELVSGLKKILARQNDYSEGIVSYFNQQHFAGTVFGELEQLFLTAVETRRGNLSRVGAIPQPQKNVRLR
ncbi:MAG: glycosyltransferase [Rhodobacteraceae bacterium]|nr:glycosyltransferase [Paracoccaceae bacterium]